MTFKREHLEPAAIAAMQTLIAAQPDASEKSIAERAVAYALALDEALSAAPRVSVAAPRSTT